MIYQDLADHLKKNIKIRKNTKNQGNASSHKGKKILYFPAIFMRFKSNRKYLEHFEKRQPKCMEDLKKNRSGYNLEMYFA